MKVLVTGGTGLVGKILQELVPEWIFIGSKEVDLKNKEETLKYIETTKPDVVVHLAANVGGLYKNLNCNKRMFEDNLDMNINIIRACESYGVKKFIAILSTCIFPDNVVYPINETMLHDGPPHRSNSGYAYSKRILDIYCNLSDMDTVCLIPTNLYGKHDNFDVKDGHVIPALIHKCFLAKKENKPFVISGSGKCLRQFMYNKDFAKIIKWSVETDFKNKHESIICSPSDEFSIEHVARCIAKKINYENIVYDMNVPEGQYKKTVSNEKLLSMTDFKFTDFEDGLKETIEWFVQNHDSCNNHRQIRI